MAQELYDNAVSPGTSTVLVNSIEPTDTVLPVANIASPTLRNPSGQFRVVVVNLQSGEMELMLVTAQAWTPNWVVQRGMEGTEALSFPIGSAVKHILTAGALQNLISQIQALQAAVLSNPQGGNYTFALSDAGLVVESTSVSAVAFTIPDNNVVDFPAGDVIEVFQRGTGQVTIAAGSPNVSLLSPGGLHRTSGQYATIGLRQSQINQWALSGSLG